MTRDPNRGPTSGGRNGGYVPQSRGGSPIPSRVTGRQPKAPSSYQEKMQTRTMESLDRASGPYTTPPPPRRWWGV